MRCALPILFPRLTDMTASPVPQQPPGGVRPRPSGFAIPARLHVFLLFMTQFIVLILALGGLVPTLHSQGMSLVLLVPGAFAGVIGVHLVLGALARLIPVRCRPCGSAIRFAGFGWWPFVYRYPCGACGHTTRLEISG